MHSPPLLRSLVPPPAGLYAAVLPPCGAVLELCASAHSHLPPGLQLRSCVGTGMNADELGANAALSGWWVQDLNEQPHSKLKGQVDGVYDAVLCINGVQYLTQPEAVLSEVRGSGRRAGLMCACVRACCQSCIQWAGSARAGAGAVHTQHPRAAAVTRVFPAQACRVLRPRGLLVLAFGDHCFREKVRGAALHARALPQAQRVL